MRPDSQKKNQIILILGKKGSGKSTLAKNMFRRLKRAIVFDVQSEYHEGIIFNDFSSLVTWLQKNHYREQFRLVCRFNSDDEYRSAMRLIEDIGDLWVVIEELNWHLTAATSKHPEIEHFFRFGRHNRISIIGIAQRCADIPRTYTALCDTIISFRQTEPRDIDYLAKVSFIGQDNADKVQYLKEIEKGVVKNENVLIFESN